MKTGRFTLVLLLTVGCTSYALGQVPFTAGDWPQWRGPNRDGISLERGLIKEWPESGPPRVWQVETVGAGYSSIAVKGNRIYTQGDLNGVEHIIALDTKDGSIVWAVQPSPVLAQLDTKVASDIKQLDKNGDGTISEIEALGRFGWDLNKHDRPGALTADEAAEKRAPALFKELDKNGDNLLTYDEAGSLLRDAFDRMDSADTKADAAALAKQRTDAYFKLLDKNTDGRISRQESQRTTLDRQFGRLDEKDPATNKGDDQLTEAEISAGLAKYEAGKDGAITLDELKKYYVQAKLTGDGVITAEELRGAVGGYRNGMGDGPRGTPTVDGERLYVEGGNGDVACLDAATGKTLWHCNLRADFGGGVPGWGYSESPLIVGEMVIVTPGGKAGTLVALNKSTGEQVWRSSDVQQGAHYSSPVLATIHGMKQIVQFANKSVFGVSLADGKGLWSYTAPANGTANCCAPIVENNEVLASSSYGVGGGLARITPAGSTQVAEEVYFEKKLACHHGGIVKVGDYIYSAGGGPLMCMEFETGKIKWQARSAGKGALLVADDMLYILGEGHDVALAEVSPESYNEKGRFKLTSHGRPAWAHPVVAGGRLYIRDQQSLTAYDIKAK